MAKSTLIDSWITDLQEALDGQNFSVVDVRIGVFYTGALLSDGSTGVAFTPRGLNDTVCCPKTASAAPPAGKLAGRDAWELALYAQSPMPLRRAVGVAVLNALSAAAVNRHGVQGGRAVAGLDALAAADVQPGDRVAMVGGFLPFIKALKGRVEALWVIDKHPEALKEDELTFWRPPEQALDVLSQADVVIITGSSLVEGGIDELLQAAANARRIVLTGPTASPWPPTFFERGIHILGGIDIADGKRMLQVVSEGGSGYFFEDSAAKVSVIRND